MHKITMNFIIMQFLMNIEIQSLNTVDDKSLMNETLLQRVGLISVKVLVFKSRQGEKIQN